MIITGKHLSRRTLLRGLGVSISLPMLDSMMPAMAAPAKAAGKMPVRLGFAYVPNGMTMADWTPQTPGAAFEMAPILKRFEPFKNDMLVFGNMMDHNGNALGDGGGDHARAGGSFLTGVHPKKTSGKDIQVGISVDQVAANAIGDTTKVRSLELSCEDSRTVGNCDSGYSCAYSSTISWRSATTPVPKLIQPRQIFDRLFSNGNAAERAQRDQQRQRGPVAGARLLTPVVGWCEELELLLSDRPTRPQRCQARAWNDGSVAAASFRWGTWSRIQRAGRS